MRTSVHGTTGFTLIELLVAVAILAIVSAIAIPAYTNQIEKTRRADAKAGLMDIAQRLERCFTRVDAYNAGACPSGSTSSVDGFYSIQINATASTYTLTATPAGTQTSDAGKCASFILDHLGNRSATGSYADRCWN